MYHKDTLKREFNKQLSASAFPLISIFLESPRTKFSGSNSLVLGGIETGVLLKDFAQRLKHKNIPIPDIYFTLFDTASIESDFVFNSHAKGNEIGA